jgi:hypothetical protein
MPTLSGGRSGNSLDTPVLSCRVPASPAPWLELILVIKRLEAPLSRGGGCESIHMRWADPLVRFLDFFVRVVHT